MSFYQDKEHLDSFVTFLAFDMGLAVMGLMLGSIIEAIMAQLDLVAQTQQWLKYFLGLIQFAIISVTLYALAKLYKNISIEFQSTYSGLLFVALFFNSQAGFVYRAQLPLNMAVQALRQIKM